MSTSGVVEQLLAHRIGLDSSTVGEGLIARGVLARMSALGIRDRGDYERTLMGPGDELQALVEEVVVPESWFFRDDRPFEVLRESARAGWMLDPARPPLAVLSVPCAGGEEPYSIAMSLIELGLPPVRFRVDAADVSARSVAKAIAGVYGPNSFRGVDERVRARYFREQGGAFTLDPAVRSTVRFHLGNLLDPAFLAGHPPSDVVFCRNLLIYFDAPARALAFAAIGRLLADGGLLFLGHADRPDDSPGSPFSLLPEKGSFAYRKGPAAVVPKPEVLKEKALLGGGGSTPRRRPNVPVSGIASRAASLTPSPSPSGRGGAERRTVEVGASEAASLTPGPSPGGRGGAGRGAREPVEPSPALESSLALDEASKLADEGRYDEATRRVDRAIAEGGASARAFFLLGMIGQAAGDRDRAEAFFLKAVYLDAQHDEALLALALLARRRGDVAAESVYRRRADRVRARKGAP